MIQHSAHPDKSGSRLLAGFRFFCIGLLCLGFQQVPLAESLDEIARLSRSGASQLALARLDASQPRFADAPVQWQRWERMRVRILEQRGKWAVLAKRLEDQPQALDETFRRWSQGRRANALLRNGQAGEARALLRGLLWHSETASSEEQAQWRQLVMQSYLEQGRIDDAYIALLRYQQDYGQGGGAALLLRARILLARGYAAEAQSLLETVEQDAVSERLWQLARLRSGTPPATIQAQLRKQADIAELPPQAQYLHYGVLAEAAVAAGDDAATILALEQWYRLPPPQEQWAELFTFEQDRLWQAYTAYAMKVGNREQLLLGNDPAWLKLARETEARYPVRKRSLFALVSQQGAVVENRQLAAQELASSLQQLDNGMAVVEQLFLHSDRYRAGESIPAGVAYLLVDQALHDGRLEVAAKLLQQLPEPPDNGARFPWQLRRIKVFILAADYAAAESQLQELIPLAVTLGQAPRDQLIQLLFDLQAVAEHERAYSLLQTLYRQVPDLKLRRELLFWMADSRQALGDPIGAARLYLLSATLIDVQSMDPWAQTARYKAAESLADGNMLEDAAHLYAELLRVTEQPERRAVLRRGLEQVRMRQAAGG